LGRRKQGRLRVLAHELARRYPEVEDAEALVATGCVLVDGRIVTNPRSLVSPAGSIVVVEPRPLRGEAKLRAALDAFDLEVGGRVCLDVGAAAGGFTRVLLEAGAARVYAVDAGWGQLLGSLRIDPRVVHLERTNLGALSRELVPDTLDVITLDLSYLAVARAVPQLDPLVIADGADLVALVKPMFELGLPAPPADPGRALVPARRGLEESGWRCVASIPSPVTGARGAAELLVHAVREPGRAPADPVAVKPRGS
jgi:23S rRNA (cytidine1920-2'-O)/16S rRNA (cytidine1409-2'-O)-methyltransferase